MIIGVKSTMGYPSIKVIAPRQNITIRIYETFSKLKFSFHHICKCSEFIWWKKKKSIFFNEFKLTYGIAL
jgi:hypothetical protein